MIFTTQLELNITIKDINAIYATDYDQMLLDHAKLMYERKCRDGQYIKSIDSLVKRSLPNLIKSDLIAKVRVYVVVEATVIRYDQYDLITGMTIIRIIPAGKIGKHDMIECRNDHVVAFMRVQKGVEQFKVNDTILIRVGQSMYKIGNSHILVNGYPFLPYLPETVRYSIGSLSSEIKTYYKNMLAPLLEREINRKNTLDQSQWNMFAALLLPYTKEEKLQGPIDVLDVDSFANGNFGVDYRVDMTKLKVTNAEPKATENAMVVPEDPKQAITRIVFQFVKHFEVINDLVERYPNEEAFKQVDYIWDLYRENKF